MSHFYWGEVTEGIPWREMCQALTERAWLRAAAARVVELSNACNFKD